MDATYLFAKNLTNIRYEDLPPGVVEATKKQVLDLLGVAVGGFSKPGPKELREIVTDWGGKEESSIIGCTQKFPAPNAAHVNATMAHALDYDDVHETAIMHSGVAIIPTCIAMAECRGNVSGRELVASIALGVDMMCRLALATTPGTRPLNTGWHLTTLYGFLGAAGTAARMLRLDEGGILNALGIAYHQCSGNGQCVIDGALTKRMGPGFSVKGGITAALLAEKGVSGAKNCLEGEWGLYKLYHRGNYNAKALTMDLGETFEGINVAIKPYPCCRGVHPAIDAALALVDEHNIKAEDVQKITLSVSEGHYHLLCEPEDAKLKPRNPVDAQFSIPWGVATAIVRKGVTLEHFTEAAVKSQDILGVVNKMSIEQDTSLNRSEKIEPTRVKIRTKEGSVYSKEVEDPLGSLERPMSFDDCARKFRDCAKQLRDEQADRVIELIGRLERLNDIREIIKPLSLG
ncbi:MAG: MmgE/PrpD family protein [Thermodesulfobacteriota bacterium]